MHRLQACFLSSWLTGCLGWCLLALPALTQADEGHPVAVRLWPNQSVSIETMWNFHIGVELSEATRKVLPREVDLEIYAQRRPDSEPTRSSKVSKVLVWSAADSDPFVLDRKPNALEAHWAKAEVSQSLSGNAVQIVRVSIPDGDNTRTLTVLEVDGVRIACSMNCSASDLARLLESGSADEKLKRLDVLVFGSAQNIDAGSLQKIARGLEPRSVVFPRANETRVVGDAAVRVIEHNTLAVSKAAGAQKSTAWVALGEEPWKMSEELATLFEKKEKSSRDSQDVFRKLSVNQLNFQPSNGTHTPRWNTEHMMGRELIFFSQIYHAVDAAIPVLDINPRQMPEDYEAAHPDWTGEEEARQTERVQAFTRRYAYLLEGMNLDERAKGSRFWTPRALLEQMIRHYGEHTANVIKKMDLPDWPEE